ncbi:MAG: TetR/AcrR family transcriptional regulator [Bacillus sp. (in: firmicutes)]
MKKKRNSVNVFSKDCIATALIKLMKQKNYEDITVTDICHTAGVSRVTYYRNYKSKEDIITQYLQELTYQFDQEVNSLNASKDVYKWVLAYFRFWMKHRGFLICLEESRLSYLMLLHINSHISSLSKTAKQKYVGYCIVGSLHNMLLEWMKEGISESPEELAKIVCDIYHKPIQKNRKTMSP